LKKFKLDNDHSIIEELKKWRRYLHRYPELSFNEFETAKYIEEELKKIKVDKIIRPTETSVVASLNGGLPGKTIAVRADIDALPILEKNDHDFISTNKGVMHACGHDGHTAILLGLAKILTKHKEDLPGTIKFVFQHGEENYPGGARAIVETGCLEDADMVIGTHLWSPFEVDTVGFCSDVAMAGIHKFFININGKGGHAGLPHQSIDSISVASQVYDSLQHMVARTVDSTESIVISVTRFNAGGEKLNVIPEQAQLAGTVRYLSESEVKTIPKKMQTIVRGICEANSATYDFEYTHGYKPVVNNHVVTDILKKTAEKLFPEQVMNIKPIMGGDDFGVLSEKIPGCYFFVGIGNHDKGIIFPHHHPKFDMDEKGLINALKIFAQGILDLQKFE